MALILRPYLPPPIRTPILQLLRAIIVAIHRTRKTNTMRQGVVCVAGPGSAELAMALAGFQILIPVVILYVRIVQMERVPIVEAQEKS